MVPPASGEVLLFHGNNIKIARNEGASRAGGEVEMSVTPKDAATVILLRRASGEDRGFEVLIVLRSSGNTFVPRSYVFPGGKVEDEDCLQGMEDFCGEFDATRAQDTLDDMPLPEKALGIWVAAVREMFEEVGLLFARRGDGSFLSFDSDGINRRFLSYRERVHSGELLFAEMLQREGLTLALDRLHYYSHWITPELSPIRYDTRFFIAEAPPDQEAIHDGDELTGHVWLTPEEAIEGYRKQRLHMVVPTIVTLEELCRFETIDDVVESTRGKKISRVMTRIVFEGDDVQEHAPDGRIFRNLVPPR